MTIGNRLMVLGLVGSASITVLLATQVAAVVPPDEMRREEASLPVCSPSMIEFARERAAGHMRQLALVDSNPAPATDYVSGLALIEQRKRLAGYKAFLAEERDSSLRTIAMCGQPTATDRCFGYRPETAEQLARYEYEYENEWRGRVQRARAEAKVCGVVLPEATDPGPDCSDANLTHTRTRLAAFAREPLIDAATSTRAYWDEQASRRLREVLATCGQPTDVDVCFGFDREQNEMMLRDAAQYGGIYLRRVKAALALCAGT